MKGLVILGALTGVFGLLHVNEKPLLIEPTSASVLEWPDAVSAPPSFPQIERVMCYASDRAGTAVRISRTQMVSAAHVTRNEGCLISGRPFTVAEDSGEEDWSILNLPGNKGIRVNCEGFKPGQWYYAVGYANASPWQTVVRLYSRFDYDKSGMGLFNGLAIPGMSGGAVVNLQGEMVGIVNARDEVWGVSFSRALKDTPVCQA